MTYLPAPATIEDIRGSVDGGFGNVDLIHDLRLALGPHDAALLIRLYGLDALGTASEADLAEATGDTVASVRHRHRESLRRVAAMMFDLDPEVPR